MNGTEAPPPAEGMVGRGTALAPPSHEAVRTDYDAKCLATLATLLATLSA